MIFLFLKCFTGYRNDNRRRRGHQQVPGAANGAQVPAGQEINHENTRFPIQKYLFFLKVAGTLSVVNGLLHFVIYMLVLCHVQGRMEEDNGALLMDILVVRTFRYS